MEAKKVSIVGAGSISAAFLMKIISRHKYAELNYVFSTSQAGKKVADYHSFLTGTVDKKFEEFDNEKLINDSDVIFITRPHAEFLDESAGLIMEAISKGIKVIDLSADFRLKDTALYKEWYGVELNYKNLVAKAVYGLTELYADKIKDAELVANP